MLNALAAAALARAVGTPAVHIARALEVFQVGRHRAELIARVADVAYVDDSKATNPHAAAASIAGYPRVVWIAGGLLKGAAVDDLVRDCADRLGAVVLIGRDRALIAEALARHAPDVPVVAVVTREDAGVQEANVVYVTDEADGVALTWVPESWPRPSGTPAHWPGLATPCFWLRQARPSTNSAGIPSVATGSPRRCTHLPVR